MVLVTTVILVQVEQQFGTPLSRGMNFHDVCFGGALGDPSTGKDDHETAIPCSSDPSYSTLG